MDDQPEPECQLRRRRTSGNPSLPLHLEVGFQINDGNPEDGTPSPSKPYPGTSKRNSAAFLDFKNKQQSFDIQVARPATNRFKHQQIQRCSNGVSFPRRHSKHGKPFVFNLNRLPCSVSAKESFFSQSKNEIEECEEEEIMIDSEDDDENENGATASGINRAVTPTPIQDFGANVTYMEGPPATDFLKVKTIDTDCYTDVSDADTEDEE